MGIERYLLKVHRGLKHLQEECAGLKRENEELRTELDKLAEAQDVSIQPKKGKKGGRSAASFQAEIRTLKGEVRKLETARDKLKKRVKQLEIREARREAAELNEDAEDGADDSAYHMRKLLRKFQDLVSETVLDEKEECVICMETLKPKESSSFPCEHVVCNACLPQINPGSEIINCPQCRKPAEKSDIELVTRTASQQWDALVDIAKRWGHMDRRREMSSSEEEAEASSVDDGQSAASHGDQEDVEPESSLSAVESTPPPSTSATLKAAPLPSTSATLEATPPPSGSASLSTTPPVPASSPPATLPATPPPSGSEHLLRTPSTSYLQSPAADKRKRMQELAEQRKRRKGLR